MYKILVFGHTWVRHFENYQAMFPHPKHMMNFYCVPGGSFEEMFKHIQHTLTKSHTHIMVFATITEAYKQSYLRDDSAYPIIVPNTDFDLQDLSNKMKTFTELCQRITPGVKVILMLEPIVDVNFWNGSRMEDYPPAVRASYERHELYKSSALHELNLQHYSKVRQITEDFCDWPGKKVLDIQALVENLPNYSFVSQFMNNEIHSLMGKGPLIDGIHPHTDFISEIWVNISDSKLLNTEGSLTITNGNLPVKDDGNFASDVLPMNPDPLAPQNGTLIPGLDEPRLMQSRMSSDERSNFYGDEIGLLVMRLEEFEKKNCTGAVITEIEDMVVHKIMKNRVKHL